jgi:hypothetical protein
MTAATMDGGNMKLTVLSKYTNSSAEKPDKKGNYNKKFTNVIITPDPAKDPDLHPELLVGDKQDKAEQYKFYMSDDSTEEVFNYKLPQELINQIKVSGNDKLSAFNVYLVIEKEK